MTNRACMLLVTLALACSSSTKSGPGPSGVDGAAPAAPACPGVLAAGDHRKTVEHDGATREYLVHVPASYDGSKPVPLVIDIHGLTSTMDQQMALSGWREKSDQVGFLAVYPNGLGASWNAGSLCCGESLAAGVDDEGFIRAVVARMEQEACIDPKRVYATGLSNGGAMSFLLACRAADLFAAAAPVSMGNGTIPCQPSRTISVVMFRGTADLLVAYDGLLFPSAQADFDQWKTVDACPAPPSTTHGICQTATGCSGGTEVTLCTIAAGHVLYAEAAAQGAAIPDVAWEAFARQVLP